MSDYEIKVVSDKSTDQQIVKFIFDLSKEMNIEDTRGVVGNELELIALVRNCRFLYDKNVPDFKDIRKKNIAWGAIASVMHSRVHDVQQRWRSLREGYNKYKKELESLGETHNDTVRPWEFYDDMKFIEPYIVHRRSAFSRTSIVNFSEEIESLKDDSIISSNSEHNSDIMQLISCIQQHPVLYDSKHPNYKVRESKMHAWNEVAQAVGASANECEIKWKNLRERYGRERKLKDTQTDKKPWDYFEALSFLDTHIKQRRHSIFRPILPKPPVQEGGNNVTILNNIQTPLSGKHTTIILKQVVDDVIKPPLEVGDQEDLEEIKLNPHVEVVKHVEFVDASNAMPPCSPSASPTPSDSKLNLRTSYLSPSSEHSQFSHDEDELFGQTITAELRRMPSGKKKMKIKAEIYKILYENESDN